MRRNPAASNIRHRTAPPVEAAVARMLAEWKRSTLPFWALALIVRRPRYGLEIQRTIEASTQGRLRLAPGTIYQLLRRLEAGGLLTSRWQRSHQGPRRAYYRATFAGREVVRRFVAELLAKDSPIPAALDRLVNGLSTG